MNRRWSYSYTRTSKYVRIYPHTWFQALCPLTPALLRYYLTMIPRRCGCCVCPTSPIFALIHYSTVAASVANQLARRQPSHIAGAQLLFSVRCRAGGVALSAILRTPHLFSHSISCSHVFRSYNDIPLKLVRLLLEVCYANVCLLQDGLQGID